MGLAVGQETDLSTTFELTEPMWDMAELFDRAIDGNPTFFILACVVLIASAAVVFLRRA